jgi:hypothetical protein
MMTVEEAATEWYVMACRRCDRTWQISCQVRVLHDDAGDRRLYFRNGVPIPAPWSTICPYCGGQRVTLVPHPATDAWTATRA